MQYFQIETIKEAIDRLRNVSTNWLIPAFVFAANDVGQANIVNMAKTKGTDQFLDRYFHGSLIGLPDYTSGNNLMRPRLRGVKARYPDDYVVQQDTKMWGNLFSSRGYREMRQRDEIEGDKSEIRLTANFKPAFEQAIDSTFEFEDFLVWLFAFNGFPDEINSWDGLLTHFLEELKLTQFQADYMGRFKLTPGRTWPVTTHQRPSNDEFQMELAAGRRSALDSGEIENQQESTPQLNTVLDPDDAVLARVKNAINQDIGRAFLFAGPPGTGKTHWAHGVAASLAEGDSERVLSLQFHPAFGYEDFVEGFRPAEKEAKAVGEPSGVTYILEDRHILKFSTLAKASPDNLFVVIIDEINRGDIFRIFGELLTYLEVGYRDKDFTLAISGKTASLPRNLIVIATANPFDRSVTDLDDALLRRFIVVMMEPDAAALEAHLQSNGVDRSLIRKTLHLFNLVNQNLPAGFGHTSFLKVRSIEDLAEVWEGRIQLAVRRAMFHEKRRYDDFVAEIQQLLRIDEASESSDDEAAQ